jgi:hypothetical protein
MAEESPGLRRLPVRVIKWLGHDILEQHPIVRMLHESRAMAAAQEKKLPLHERPSYQIRQQRIFARGRKAGDDAIAKPPDAPAAAEAADIVAAEPAEAPAAMPERSEP